MNNKLVEYNGAKLKPIIEYYDYSKLGKNPGEQGGNNQMKQNKPYQGNYQGNRYNQNYNQNKQYPKQNNFNNNNYYQNNNKY